MGTKLAPHSESRACISIGPSIALVPPMRRTRREVKISQTLHVVRSRVHQEELPRLKEQVPLKNSFIVGSGLSGILRASKRTWLHGLLQRPVPTSRLKAAGRHLSHSLPMPLTALAMVHLLADVAMV